MKLRIDLKGKSSPAWLEAVMNDFDAFLQDHADCERKASAMAMSFIAKYPDRQEIIPELIATGIEELEHFEQVFKIMQERGVALRKDIPKDEYVNALLKHCKSDPIQRFMDRLLLASIVECRGAERFRMVCEAQEDEDLKTFYRELWTSEAKHGNIFVEMALEYFPEEKVYARLEEWNVVEAEVLAGLPIRAALH